MNKGLEEGTTRISPGVRNALLVLCCAIYLAGVSLLVYRHVLIVKYSAGTRGEPTGTAVAVLDDSTGSVVVRRKGAVDYTRLELGEELFAGDIVQTKAASSATLRFGEKTRFTLDHNALLKIQADDKSAEYGGAVLQLTQGSFNIDSEELGDDIVAIQTSQAVIRLKIRDVSYFFPEEFVQQVQQSGEAADFEMEHLPHSIQYLKYLSDKYMNEAPEENEAPDPEIESALTAVQDALTACEPGDSDKCRSTQDIAWKQVIAYHERHKDSDRVMLSVSIDETGNEKIDVKQGTVKVETETRTVALAQGDKLDLEPGRMMENRPFISDSARDAVLEAEPAKEIPLEIETFYWEGSFE